MNRTGTDAVLAFCIGALVGVGAALLIEAGEDHDDETAFTLRQLRRKGLNARIASDDDQRTLRTAVACVRRVSRRGLTA